MRRYSVSYPNKPPLGFDVDRWHALARGFKAGFLLSEFAGSATLDVVSKRRTGAFTGAPLWVGGRVGAVVRTTATTDTIPLLSNDLILPLTNCTIVIALYKTDSTLRPCFHLGTELGLSSVECGMAIPYNDGKVYFDWGANRQEGVSRLSVAQTFAPMQRDVFAFSTGTRGMRIYRNGRLIASNTANPQRTSNTSVVTLNTQYGGSGDLSNYESVLIWWEQLSDSDAIALTLNPYQIFDLALRRPAMLGIPMQAISGLATLTLSTSAALLAGKMAGKLKTCGHPLSTACEDWLLGDD